jgi:hypothetical protein
LTRNAEKPAHALHKPGGDQPKEARNAHVRHDDHHAQEQGDGAEVDCPVRILDGKHAGRHHQAGAEERRTGPIKAQPG